MTKAIIQSYVMGWQRRSISITIGAFACLGFSRLKWISVAKSAKLVKIMTKKRDLTEHF